MCKYLQRLSPIVWSSSFSVVSFVFMGLCHPHLGPQLRFEDTLTIHLHFGSPQHSWEYVMSNVMLCLTRLMQGSARTGYEASGEQGYPAVAVFLLEYFNALDSQKKYEVGPVQTYYLQSWFSPNTRSSWQPFLSPHREPNPSKTVQIEHLRNPGHHPPAPDAKNANPKNQAAYVQPTTKFSAYPDAYPKIMSKAKFSPALQLDIPLCSWVGIHMILRNRLHSEIDALCCSFFLISGLLTVIGTTKCKFDWLTMARWEHRGGHVLKTWLWQGSSSQARFREEPHGHTVICLVAHQLISFLRNIIAGHWKYEIVAKHCAISWPSASMCML